MFTQNKREFKKGQAFDIATSDQVKGIPRYSLIIIDADDEKLLA
jgi:hypothetical protein